jgi:hypothetical protein
MRRVTLTPGVIIDYLSWWLVIAAFLGWRLAMFRLSSLRQAVRVFLGYPRLRHEKSAFLYSLRPGGGTLPPANQAAALAAMRKSRKGLAQPGVDN